MYKSLLALSLITALAGCSSSGGSDPKSRFYNSNPDVAGVRCGLMMAGEQPLKPEDLSFLKEQAERDNPACMTMLGMVYRDGEKYGTATDFDKARELFTRGAKDDPTNNVMLGLMAERGEGEPEDYVKARKLYETAGPAAAPRLGALLEAGLGGPRDAQRALALYAQSTREVGDHSWDGMVRLRQQGLVLDQQQKLQYQRVWARSFQYEIKRRMAEPYVRDAIDGSEDVGSPRTVKLAFSFTADSGKPQAKLLEGSGDAQLDAVVMQAADQVTMGPFAPYTPPSGKLDVTAPLTLVRSKHPVGAEDGTTPTQPGPAQVQRRS